MLDQRTAILLEAVCEACKTGTYQVIEQSELLDYFPEAYRSDEDGLRQMMERLQKTGFVDVRYADGKVYCVAPLPEGRLYLERQERERIKERLLLLRIGIVAGIASFLGALLGGLFPRLF